ncbi:hypothetical protein VNI00_005461 [Paramarasmius palmivorus]|uniref:BTB domain-containing protein n=1 Tax=Paramarasmius palmivorus TaxID=297713 RepID=A0AAW0DHT3_9AGAR
MAKEPGFRTVSILDDNHIAEFPRKRLAKFFASPNDRELVVNIPLEIRAKRSSSPVPSCWTTYRWKIPKAHRPPHFLLSPVLQPTKSYARTKILDIMMNRVMSLKSYSSSSPASSSLTLGCDIILKSSDGKLLGAHMKNLEIFNEGFPLEGSITCDLDDTVELTEDAETLRLLLLFSHNSSYPDLSKLDIDVVLALGDAAEKYGNHLAFMACSQTLGHFARRSSEHALKVLRFKASHSDFDEIEETARRTMDIPILDAMHILGRHHNIFRVWLQYQQNWLRRIDHYHAAINNTRIREDHKYANGSPKPCPTLEDFVANIKPVLQSPEFMPPSVDNFSRAVAVYRSIPACKIHCDHCSAYIHWRRCVRESLEELPSWRDFSVS